MELSTLQGITTTNAKEIIDKVIKRHTKVIKFGKKKLTIAEVLKQYNPNDHDVHDKEIRKDKSIMVPAPDSTDDKEHLVPETVYVNRSSIPMQRLIVSRACAFLTGNPIAYDSTPANDKEKAMLAAVKRVMDINKMDYLNAEIAEKMKSETHCALLWYIVDNSGNPDADDDFEGIDIDTKGLTLRCKIFAKSLGDDIYPIFDRMGVMVGVMRVWNELTDDDQKIKNTDFYLDAKNIFIQEADGSTDVTITEKTNTIGKGQVMYFAQDEPEWLVVQPNISRNEDLISNTGDTNDYYASPTTVVNGDVEGFSKKGERGKILQVGKDASVSLLEAKNGVESVRFEYETQKAIMLEGSQTPDISFESMKSLGVFSGTAIKLLFFDASLKVKNQLPTYGKTQQRSINFVKAALAKFDPSFKTASRMVIKPVIEAYMPENVTEALENLAMATGNQPFMSVDTAVKQNPLVKNPDEEVIRLAKETEKRVGENLAA